MPPKNYPNKAMQITDLNGYPIEVTDINEAIRITAQYMEYRHESKSFSEFDKRQKAYWLDIYKKLMGLNQLLNDPKK
ncbi:hypothetical protein QO200_03995 [Flavobacterium sp. Arc3]|uniref:hypothetical protein n=1 Tax=Flavobacterium sp. Arc3 TaxID=3046686 RepID=UPI00352C3E79